jgi:sarcosine oxidase, subunit alpha
MNHTNANHSQSSGEPEPSCDFEFDGRTIRAQLGQTLAGALHDAGEHVLSRSFKYHRPRGLLCCSGRCPNCLCTVDGVPNMRICTTVAKPGMVVRSQNAWPSLQVDFLGILDKFSRFMPVGFYYKRMYKPRWMWPIWEAFIRRIAGLGQVDRRTGGAAEYSKQNLFTDIVVVGAGWAGLHAALAAADAGRDVTLVDEQPALGGHLRHDPDLAGRQLALLLERVERHPRIERLASAVVFGCYEENYLGIQQGNRLIRLRAQQVVVATGGWERPYVFENNDRPGVLLASAAQRLVHLDKCRIDGPAVIVTDNSQGYRAARQLAKSGTKIAAVVDLRDQLPADDHELAVASGGGVTYQVLTGRTILAALGTSHVEGAVVGDLRGGSRQTIPCRWIIQSIGFNPANSLLYQNGCKLAYDAACHHAVVSQYARGMHSAGAVNGTHDLNRVKFEGRRAGLAAIAALDPGNEIVAAELREMEAQLTPVGHGSPSGRDAERAAAAQTDHATAKFVTPATDGKRFVCLCEDVTEKDICDAVAEGYSNIETLKRYSTVSMGPCQGKMCQAASIALCARENNVSIEATGVTTARPPEQPVPLGLLAGRAVHLSLERRTPMHDWHLRAGAVMGDAGNWKRPQVYTSIEQEYEAVRERAGLVDVSTLGKIDLRGKDVARFLEFVYPNRFANLKIGRVRYGVICDDAGILLDDGTISRLGEDRFFLTTTTGNADAIDSWFRWWLTANPELDVRMTNVSGSFAAMNLAGPKARDILKKLTSADLSTTAMPYLAAHECTVAGVPAIVLRIGFVGECGYEIHVPTQYGLFVWEQIMAAGKDADLEPFGVEAQRLLRLEKKHLLAGIDTDALSNPIEADMPWIVKLDKSDFIGRRSLAGVNGRGPRQRLIGFRLDRDAPVEPASLIVHDGRLGGRVTSCSYSPAAGCAVGLAWVPAAAAKNGDRIEIRIDGQSITAVVQDEPFYDPEGARLKS